MQINSLVIFKNKPARVISYDGKKIKIQLKNNKIFSIPEKKLLLLYKHNFNNFDKIDETIGDGELIESWNLLEGQRTNYVELSELIYGEYSISTSYATWKQVQKNIYFTEDTTNSYIIVNNRQTVQTKIKELQEQNKKQKLLENFIINLKNKTFCSEDLPFIKEIVNFTLGKSTNCRFFKYINKKEDQNNAHKLLLDIGYWDIFINPYPSRFGVNINEPSYLLPNNNKHDIDNRIDLTHFEAYAIDDEDIHDPDDAISFDEKTNKYWVHIADPSSIIQPNNDMDIEACTRGTNLYLTEKCIPMLPHKVTKDYGLGLNTISPALSIGYSIVHGKIENIDLLLSKIKVKRISYKETEMRLQEQPFKQFHDASKSFNEIRYKHGYIELHFPEIKLKLINNKVNIITLEKFKSRTIVRDAMLMAGVAVAKFAMKYNIPLPFANNIKPSIEIDKKNCMKYSEMFAIRKQFKKTQFHTHNEGHGVMALSAYVQTTSPLRRYLDLVVHQQLRSFLKEESLLSHDEILSRISTSEYGRKGARKTEHFTNTHWKCVFLMQNPSWKGHAIVIEKNHGSNVTIFIPSLSLIKKINISKSIELNQKIYIQLSSVNITDQSIFFKMINIIE